MSNKVKVALFAFLLSWVIALGVKVILSDVNLCVLEPAGGENDDE